MQTTLTIEGMHCDACAQRVQRVLEREAGVRAAEVSFGAGEARVDYDERVIRPARLEAAVAQAGYTARTGA